MEIRKIGPQPEDNFFIMPNAAIRDRRLSYRARGLMAVISSHVSGFHVSSDELAEGGKEGIKAVRTAMNELITWDYMRRVRSQDEQGRWRTRIDVYIWGDAPPARMDVVLDSDVEGTTSTDEPFPPVGEPVAGQMDRPPTQNGEAVMVHVGEHHSEDQSSISPSIVEPPTQVSSSSHLSKDEPNDSPDVPSSGQPTGLPMVLRRMLRDAGVAEPAMPIWETAWLAAQQAEWPDWAEVERTRFHADHLPMYLSKTREQGHKPSAGTWLDWYHRDRVRQMGFLRGRLDQEARLADDPAEREARQNRHLPPDRSDLDRLCHGCGCVTGTEPHKDGCRVAARQGASL